MEENTEKFLNIMLEGYNNNISGITQYLENTEQQLKDAKTQKAEMVDHVAELEELLGVTHDEEAETEEAVVTE